MLMGAELSTIKENTTGLVSTKFLEQREKKAHVGVHVYTSENLTSWTDAGIALRVSDDPESARMPRMKLMKVLICLMSLSKTVKRTTSLDQFI